jgi:hypothetical protein
MSSYEHLVLRYFNGEPSLRGKRSIQWRRFVNGKSPSRSTKCPSNASSARSRRDVWERRRGGHLSSDSGRVVQHVTAAKKTMPPIQIIVSEE